MKDKVLLEESCHSNLRASNLPKSDELREHNPRDRAYKTDTFDLTKVCPTETVRIFSLLRKLSPERRVHRHPNTGCTSDDVRDPLVDSSKERSRLYSSLSRKPEDDLLFESRGLT